MKFLPIIVATLAATSYATECEDLSKSESQCMSSSQGNEHCSFCTSAAVGSTCIVESDAKSLPSSVFHCEYQTNLYATTTCDANTKESTCMSATEGSEKCSWCTSGAVGASCLKESDAAGLPSSVFQCEFQASLKAMSYCEDAKNEDTCMSSAQDGVSCSWCTSGAVGASCMKEDDAKGLPSSVFQCEYQGTIMGYYNYLVSFIHH